jgi:hypothetical protein
MALGSEDSPEVGDTAFIDQLLERADRTGGDEM